MFCSQNNDYNGLYILKLNFEIFAKFWRRLGENRTIWRRPNLYVYVPRYAKNPKTISLLPHHPCGVSGRGASINSTND